MSKIGNCHFEGQDSGFLTQMVKRKQRSKCEASPSVGFLVVILEKIFDSTILDASDDPARLGDGDLDQAVVHDNLHPFIVVTSDVV